MLKKSLFVYLSIFVISSQLFSQATQDDVKYDINLTFLNPDASEFVYDYEDFIEITSRHEGKPPPPRRRSRSYSSSSYDFGGLLSFSLVGMFNQYSIVKGYKTSASSSSYSFDREYTFKPNDNINSFMLGLKTGFHFDIFATYCLVAVDVLAFERGAFDFDSRFGCDIILPFGEKETISFVASPYLSMKLASGSVGEIITYLKSSNSSYTSTSIDDAEVSQFSIGIGALAGFKLKFTDMLSMTAMGGYRFYFINAGAEAIVGAESYLNINGLNLSGWEVSLSFDIHI